MSDTDVVVSTWRELLALHASVSCALERELGEKHGLGVSEFEVLDHMADALARGESGGKHKFRVQELAEQTHLSQSALSRLIARLEREGLLLRVMCENDRRGVYVHLTEAGRERHAEAVPTHRAVLAARLTESATESAPVRP